jgi:hypothetical protein
MSVFVNELSAYKMAAALPYAEIKRELLFYCTTFLPGLYLP